MLLSSLIAATLCGSAMAWPFKLDKLLPPKNLEKREVGGIFVTSNVNWAGNTYWAQYSIGECVSLEAPWLYSISSIGPDPGTLAILAGDQNCTAQGPTVTHPGIADLRQIGWNDKIGSFRILAANST